MASPTDHHRHQLQPILESGDSDNDKPSTSAQTTTFVPINSKMTMDPAHDRPIMATAENAILAKQATVQTGYYQDPFLEAFADKSSLNLVTTGRRQRHVQPIIKRGTHARVCCMDRAISAFLKLHPTTTNTNDSFFSCQIVVLGAGKDTSYFRHQHQAGALDHHQSSNPSKVAWYEVDHGTVIQEKARIIQGSPLLSKYCQLQPTPHGFTSTNTNTDITTNITTNNYHLVQHDLRDDPNALFEQKLQLNKQLPTLFLLECVFMYLPNDASKRLLQSISQQSTQNKNQQQCSWIVCYEPILQTDPFGRMMQQNLVQAGVATPVSCLLQTRTLQSQLDKLLQAGFDRAVGCDMWSAYETILTQEQRQTANQAEFLDEVEEWMLIMRHYCFLAGRVGTADNKKNNGHSENDNGNEDLFTSVGPSSPLGFLSGKCQVVQKT